MELNPINPGNNYSNGALPNSKNMQKKAQELEAVFLHILLSQMFSSIKTNSIFGGGQGEKTWRSMQSEQYANLLAQNGGVGLADQIVADLLLVQENAKLYQASLKPNSVPYAANGAINERR